MANSKTLQEPNSDPVNGHSCLILGIISTYSSFQTTEGIWFCSYRSFALILARTGSDLTELISLSLD